MAARLADECHHDPARPRRPAARRVLGPPDGIQYVVGVLEQRAPGIRELHAARPADE
jgi:hypothetical protein